MSKDRDAIASPTLLDCDIATLLACNRITYNVAKTSTTTLIRTTFGPDHGLVAQEMTYVTVLNFIAFAFDT